MCSRQHLFRLQITIFPGMPFFCKCRVCFSKTIISRYSFSGAIWTPLLMSIGYSCQPFMAFFTSPPHFLARFWRNIAWCKCTVFRRMPSLAISGLRIFKQFLECARLPVQKGHWAPLFLLLTLDCHSCPSLHCHHIVLLELGETSLGVRTTDKEGFKGLDLRQYLVRGFSGT